MRSIRRQSIKPFHTTSSFTSVQWLSAKQLPPLISLFLLSRTERALTFSITPSCPSSVVSHERLPHHRQAQNPPVSSCASSALVLGCTLVLRCAGLHARAAFASGLDGSCVISSMSLATLLLLPGLHVNDG